MPLSDALISNLDDIEELLSSDKYEVQGFSIVLLIKDKETNYSGYVINYEALEFLKLIAALEVAKYRIVKASDEAVNETVNLSNELDQESDSLDQDLAEFLDLTKIDPESDTHH